VPNPYTLLTSVPPDAKFFTMIDLCSAFFSVPLAEESQYLVIDFVDMIETVQYKVHARGD